MLLLSYKNIIYIHVLAALYVDSFARNHAFNDGNKRTAIFSAVLTYAINNVYLELNADCKYCFRGAGFVGSKREAAN